jgi:phosphocarrier protein HPr
MVERKVVIAAEVGLHARPAATFVQTAAQAPFEVTVSKGGQAPVNAKSILAILGMDARQDDIVVIRIEGEGPEAEELLTRLAEICETP